MRKIIGYSMIVAFFLALILLMAIKWGLTFALQALGIAIVVAGFLVLAVHLITYQPKKK